MHPVLFGGNVRNVHIDVIVAVANHFGISYVGRRAVVYYRIRIHRGSKSRFNRVDCAPVAFELFHVHGLG